MPRLKLHRLVATEYTTAVTWYSTISPATAEYFARAFESALSRVTRNPSAFGYWQRPFRRIRLRRFPYLLIYLSDPKTTHILALVHHRRDPITIR